MNTVDLLAAIGSIIGILTVVGGAVWIVAQIKGTTQSLREAIKSLGRSMDQLRYSVETLDTKLDGHAERLTRVEARLERNGR